MSEKEFKSSSHIYTIPKSNACLFGLFLLISSNLEPSSLGKKLNCLNKPPVLLGYTQTHVAYEQRHIRSVQLTVKKQNS